MRKPELVAAIASAAQLSKREADAALDALLEHVTNALSRGESVNLVGFGALHVKRQPARTGRHPTTGEPLAIAAVNRVVFRPGKALKAAVK